MAVLKPRTKLIYFRVSEDELEQLNRACQAGGARSVSELARFAMQRALNDSSATDSSSGLGRLEGMIGELSSRVDRLAAMLSERVEHPGFERRKPAYSIKEHADVESA